MPHSSHIVRLAACTDEKALAAYLTDARAQLRTSWSPQEGGRAWCQEHADLVDALLRRLLALAAQRTGQTPQGIALLATGGYGQRALAPYSDIDLTFLVDRDDDPAILREAFRLVMDVLLSGARIKVGYAYRHISEIGGDRLDHQTQTSLLSARLVAGDGALFARFDRIYSPGLHIADFLFRKISERERVRERVGASPFLVEPDLKEGAGGLRDIQTAIWMARARYDKTGDGLWRELVRRHIVTATEKQRLQEAREHLYLTRNLLHLLSGERRERLTRERQEQIAERLGYQPDGDTPAVEAFMQRHYAAAATVFQLSDKIIQRCLEAPLALGNETGLASLRRSVVISEPRKVAADPHWPLVALEYCQRYDLDLAPATIEAIEALVEREGVPADSGTRFLNLLMQPGDVEKTVRQMGRTGLLKAILPELDACMGLIPYDPAHAYSVGEHTLQVLQNLARLRPDAPPSGAPAAYRDVFATLESPATLYLAALLHDLGKQWPRTLSGEPGPHEITGAERAVGICERLGSYPQRAESIVFLVRWHLYLAETSRLRDLGRLETIRDAARCMGELERLKMLYLLTWADTSAVGPGVWTEMAARLLEELFQRVAGALEGSEDDTSDDGHGETRRIEALRDRIRRRLSRPSEKGEAAAQPEVVQEHTQAMPAAYLLNTPLEAMAMHVAMIDAVIRGELESSVVTDLRTLTGTQQTELTLVAYDDPEPGLLAKVLGVLYACDIRLHAAQVFTRVLPDGRAVVVDTLVIDYRDQPLDRAMRTEVAAALTRVLNRSETVTDLLARRRRPEPTLGGVQNLRIEAAGEDLALLDVVVARGPGAIPALARAITAQGWNIHAARLSSWAGLIRCAVYISESATGTAGDEHARTRLRAALMGT